MFKKILATSAIFVGSLSTALAAGAFYIGPGVTYVDLKSDNITYRGLVPGLYLGYGGWVREWLNLAIEGFGTIKSINMNNQNADSLDLKMSYNYGIALIPAVLLDDVISAFARLGYIRTKFSSLDSTNGTYQFGLGLQGVISECWTLRGEYDYSKYSSVSLVGTIRSNQITASLMYSFESILS